MGTVTFVCGGCGRVGRSGGGLTSTSRIGTWLGKIPRVGVTLRRVYEWQPQYFNFMLVGGMGVVWQYLVTWMLMGVGFPWWFSMGVGIFVASFSNYLLSRHWVFKPNQPT